jgi:excisionase family DNA binding protein
MDEVWTVKQVALYLKVSQGKIYKLAQDGVLPAIKVGRTWRFRRHLIEDFLNGSFSASISTENHTQPNPSRDPEPNL